jgi:hypothetical protein
MAGIYCRTEDFTLTSGYEHQQTYEAPILHNPPAYAVTFCRHCGSVLPPADPAGEIMELPAGLLDDDPGIKPDKHIFREFLPKWDSISDDLPQFTRSEIHAHRKDS